MSLPIRQGRRESYLPERKIYLSRMTRRGFFEPWYNHSIILKYVFTWTFDIHKVAVWTLYKTLKFVLPFFFLHRGMQKIFEQLQIINNTLCYRCPDHAQLVSNLSLLICPCNFFYNTSNCWQTLHMHKPLSEPQKPWTFQCSSVIINLCNEVFQFIELLT